MQPRAIIDLPTGKKLFLYPDGDAVLDGRVVDDPATLSEDDREAVSQALSDYITQMHPSP